MMRGIGTDDGRRRFASNIHEKIRSVYVHNVENLPRRALMTRWIVCIYPSTLPCQFLAQSNRFIALLFVPSQWLLDGAIVCLRNCVYGACMWNLSRKTASSCKWVIYCVCSAGGTKLIHQPCREIYRFRCILPWKACRDNDIYRVLGRAMQTKLAHQPARRVILWWIFVRPCDGVFVYQCMQ